MSFPSIRTSQPCPGARHDGEGGKRPPRGGGSGAARGKAARRVGTMRAHAPDLIRGLATFVAAFAARPRLCGRGGVAT